MSNFHENIVDRAQQIKDHADSLNSDRIAFHGATGYLFCAAEINELVELLNSNNPAKYKLQKLDDSGRWRDLSKYGPLPNSVLEPLRTLDVNSLRGFSNLDFMRAQESDPRGLTHALRQVFLRAVVSPKLPTVRTWRKILSELANLSQHEHVVFLRTTLELLETALDQGIDDRFEDQAIYAALTSLENLRPNCESQSAQIAHSLMEGKLLSLVDRNAAAEAFQKATQQDSDSVIRAFYVDTGAFTYFPHDFESSEHLVQGVQSSIETIQAAKSTNALALTVSVDHRFFRIYSPQLYLLAQHLPEFDFVFLLCGDRIETEKAIQDGEAFLARLTELNRSGVPENIHYWRVPVPTFTGNPQTFYASARFFAAKRLLTKYERVYLMDADLLVDGDPSSYFSRIKDVDFGTATNTDMSRLSPWRRNLAGNVALSGEVARQEILPGLLRYITRGLPSDNSWMLDQNALAFAVENNESHYTPLDKFRRPFFQPRFRRTLEKQHFAS